MVEPKKGTNPLTKGVKPPGLTVNKYGRHFAAFASPGAVALNGWVSELGFAFLVENTCDISYVFARVWPAGFI